MQFLPTNLPNDEELLFAQQRQWDCGSGVVLSQASGRASWQPSRPRRGASQAQLECLQVRETAKEGLAGAAAVHVRWLGNLTHSCRNGTTRSIQACKLPVVADDPARPAGFPRFCKARSCTNSYTPGNGRNLSRKGNILRQMDKIYKPNCCKRT